MSENIIELTKDNFQEQAMQAKLPVLIDFWAPWCGPCRMVAPHVEAVAQEMEGKVVVAKVNVDDSPELGAKFGVMNIPTLVVLKGGNLVAREVGARGKKDILAMLTPHLG